MPVVAVTVKFGCAHLMRSCTLRGRNLRPEVTHCRELQIQRKIVLFGQDIFELYGEMLEIGKDPWLQC